MFNSGKLKPATGELRLITGPLSFNMFVLKSVPGTINLIISTLKLLTG